MKTTFITEEYYTNTYLAVDKLADSKYNLKNKSFDYYSQFASDDIWTLAVIDIKNEGVYDNLASHYQEAIQRATAVMTEYYITNGTNTNRQSRSVELGSLKTSTSQGATDFRYETAYERAKTIMANVGLYYYNITQDDLERLQNEFDWTQEDSIPLFVKALNGATEFDTKVFETENGKITIKKVLAGYAVFADGITKTSDVDISKNGDLLEIRVSYPSKKNTKAKDTYTITLDPVKGVIDIDGMTLENGNLSNLKLMDKDGNEVGNFEFSAKDGGKWKINGIAIIDAFGSDLGVKNLEAKDGIKLGGVKRTTWPEAGANPSFKDGVLVDSVNWGDKVDTTTADATYAKVANYDNETGSKAILNATNGNEMEFKVGELSPASFIMEKNGINMLNSQITKTQPATQDTHMVNKGEVKGLIAASQPIEVINKGATYKTYGNLGNSGNNKINVLDNGSDYKYLFYSNDLEDYVITVGKDIYLDSNKTWGSMTLKLNVGGEYIDTLLKNVGVNLSVYKDAYILTTHSFLWGERETEVIWEGTVIIKDRDNKGDNYNRYELELKGTITISDEGGKWLPKLGEFVSYTLKEVDKQGNEKPDVEGTQYLIDPDYTEDTTPLRIFISEINWKGDSNGTSPTEEVWEDVSGVANVLELSNKYKKIFIKTNPSRVFNIEMIDGSGDEFSNVLILGSDYSVQFLDTKDIEIDNYSWNVNTNEIEIIETRIDQNGVQDISTQTKTNAIIKGVLR